MNQYPSEETAGPMNEVLKEIFWQLDAIEQELGIVADPFAPSPQTIAVIKQLEAIAKRLDLIRKAGPDAKQKYLAKAVVILAAFLLLMYVSPYVSWWVLFLCLVGIGVAFWAYAVISKRWKSK